MMHPEAPFTQGGLGVRYLFVLQILQQVFR